MYLIIFEYGDLGTQIEEKPDRVSAETRYAELIAISEVTNITLWKAELVATFDKNVIRSNGVTFSYNIIE